MGADDDKKGGPARKSGSKTGAAKGKKGRNVNESLRSFIPEEPPIPQAAPSAEDYNQVVKSARLARIFMTGAEFKSEPAYFNNGDSGSFEHNLDHELAVIENDTDAGRIAAILQWKVFVTERPANGSEKSESELEASPILSIEASYLIAYDQIEGGSENAMEHFMNRVGKMATYPYFRAHVSHINGEAEASLPLLPILR